MNFSENIQAIFLGKKFKALVSKLLQNPDYYPTKHNSRTKRKYSRHHQNMW